MKTETKKIGNDDFSVMSFPALEGLRLKAYIIKLIAPSLRELLGDKSGEDLMQTDVSKINIGGAIADLIERLSEEEFISFVKRVLRNVTVEHVDAGGKIGVYDFATNFEGTFNEVFDGNVFGIYPVILFVLEVNYPDFFALLRRTPRAQATDGASVQSAKAKRGRKS